MAMQARSDRAEVGRHELDRHELVRRANIEAVFTAISAAAPITRDEIAATTGLSRPTVLRLVSALVHHGLVRPAQEAPTQPRSVGRMARKYEADPTAGFVVGIDLGGTMARVAIADLSGEILARVEARTSRRGAKAVVAQLVKLSREVAAMANVAWDRVGVLSLGTPGIENHDGTIRLADNIPGLDKVPLVTVLKSELGCEVIWENDVNLAAIGEHCSGVAAGVDSFALLSVGTGIGLGIVINGQVLRGSRGAAGEISYLPLGAHHTDPGHLTEPEVRIRGSFEVLAAGSGVVRMYQQAAEAQGSRLINKDLTAHDIYSRAADGDQMALSVVRFHADILAQGILAVASVMDPEMVVIGGGIGANPLLIEPLRSAVDRIFPWPLPIEPSALGSHGGLIGAVQRGLQVLAPFSIGMISAQLAAGGSQR